VYIGISFIWKERDLRIHEKMEEFHISRDKSMGVGSRAYNGSSCSNPHLLETTVSFSSFLVREASPPF